MAFWWNFFRGNGPTPTPADESVVLKAAGKPDVFMGGDGRDKLRPDEGYPEDALRVQHSMVDETYRIMRTGLVSEDSSVVFREALVNSYERVWGAAGAWIIKLSHHIPDVERIALELMADTRYEVRLHLVQSIFSVPGSNAVMLGVLGAGINDKSKKVRRFAAQRIWEFNFKPLLGSLRERHALEKEEAVRHEIECAISMLSLGYHIDPDARSSETRDVIFKHGSVITTVSIPPSDLVHDKILKAIEHRISEMSKGRQ